MENHTFQACKKKIIPNLEDFTIDPNDPRPLGGLNPYSKCFDAIGDQFVNIMTNHFSISPNSRILDIGCGTGRVTKQIIKRYPYAKLNGIDVNSGYLKYCSTHYKGIYKHIDIKNPEFNHKGTIEEDKFTLPYKSKQFDVVLYLGVANHVKLATTLRYIEEISRIIKPRGYLLMTSLLLNSYSNEQINKGLTNKPFTFKYGNDIEKYEYEERPHLNISIDEKSIRRAFITHNLVLREPIYYGSWCNYDKHIMGHDIIIARKGGWGR